MRRQHNTHNTSNLMPEGGGRNVGLDIVRSLAIINVIAGHFFINTNFNDVLLDNISIFLLGMIKTITLSGVPLFLLLTGYLNCNKIQFDLRYLKGIKKVIISYLLYCVITIIFREFYLGQEKNLVGWIHEVTSFTAIPYGWYIEMWIGLYLLTPFLNILWKALKHKEQLILMSILFFCSSLPDFTNRYGLHILPEYWMKTSYPVLLFYIGSCIRQYELILNKYRISKMLFIAVALSTFDPAFSLIIHGTKPLLGLHGGPGGVIILPIAILMFISLYRIRIQLGNCLIKHCFLYISLYSLDMYLAAWMFDQLIYPIVKSNFNGSIFNLPLFILTVLSLFIGNFIFVKINNILLTYLSSLSAMIKAHLFQGQKTDNNYV